MPEVVYHSTMDTSNKFWSYEKKSTTVTIKWGRLGLSGESQVKEFNSESEANKFIAKKVREKEDKGYKLTTTEQLGKEVATAKDLGFQNKINVMKWARKTSEGELAVTINYDPDQFVYTEIVNSWTKEVTRLLLGRSSSFYIEGVAMQDRSILYDTLRSANASDTFVRGIRNALKRLSEKVVEVVRTKIASYGRKLNLGLGLETSTLPEEMEIRVEIEEDVFKTISKSESGASEQTVGMMAQLGCRKLVLD